MRSMTTDFTLERLENLEATLRRMNQEPGVWRVFAGGTDLMVQFEMGKLEHQKFLDISSFSQLNKIQMHSDYISIGSLVTYADLQASSTLQKYFPILVRSSFLTGAIAIQNRGTLGGNIANASPAADSSPGLLVYGARLNLRSQRGLREVDYRKFHQGYKKMDLAKDEIIESIQLPLGSPQGARPAVSHHLYRKVGTRAFQSISKVAVAATAALDAGVISSLKFSYSSIAAHPFLLEQLESEYLGKNLSEITESRVLEILRQEIFPKDDIRSTAEYRWKVLANLTWDFIQKIKEHPQGIVHMES